MIAHQESILLDLTERQKEGRLHPVWILKGDKGIGKTHFAIDLACALLKNNAQNPHGMSDDFVIKAVNDQHYPNFFMLNPAVQEDGTLEREISAARTKEVHKFLSQKPAIPGWRVVLIHSIDLLNRFGANALLKILEEPPKMVCFLILCHQSGKMLPTIRSRGCVLNLFSPVQNLLDQKESPLNTALKLFFTNPLAIDWMTLPTTLLGASKNVQQFQAQMLHVLHQFVVDYAHAPAFVKNVERSSWVQAYQRMNDFFIKTDGSHLDPNYVVIEAFGLLKPFPS